MTAACLPASAPATARSAPVALFDGEALPATAREEAWWSLFLKVELAPQLRRMRACLADEAACDGPSLLAWRSLAAELAPLATSPSLEPLNRALNAAIVYRPDATGHWRGPLQALTEGGDCEDIAVAKMAALIALGLDSRRLHIVVLRPRRTGLPGHAVLAVETADGLSLLDLNSNARQTPARLLARYRPEAVFSGDGGASRPNSAALNVFTPSL